ncbi:hypothetical protein A9259_03515 [Vibrio cyclitrophicus]|uniref:hypothetical protein n=1 Tax=Vibrio cyclitrophicus TaxID=47951 RepID=UPI0007EEA218|nr:hypothetical protein [Vibrio cyclitrophicus]OBT03396.1 hypothetical protein A9259_03515 [Vibrio cyclitrophicus]
MIEKVGHIKNPLTVIAVFAAIAEISGTIVLPFVDLLNQGIYIWFLMLFPVLLVSLFFLTLNFNHKVLYAPSDYKDEKHFVDLFSKASIELQEERLKEEVQEVQADYVAEKPNSVKDANSPQFSKTIQKTFPRDVMSDVVLAEKLAVNNLSRSLGFQFKTGVTFNGQSFDAIAVSDSKIHAIEVKLFKSNTSSFMRFGKVLERAEYAAKYGFDAKNFTLHIVAVIDSPNINKKQFEYNFQDFVKRFDVRVELHIMTFSDLQAQYEYAP